MPITLAAAGAALLGVRYYRLVGRFHGLRRLAAAGRRARQRLSGRARPEATPAVEAGLAQLRSRGHCPAPRLDAGTVERIRRFAAAPLALAGAASAAVVEVADPLACVAVRQVAQDPFLFEMAAAFLGYRPRPPRVRLFWSPVVELSAEARRAAGQTVDFHYDIEACNALYLYFYLAGGRADSGAHVVIEGSHGPKPLAIALGSCFQDEARLLARYGAERVAVVEGPAGFGFFEDPACFHKALPPNSEARLCLQLRYV